MNIFGKDFVESFRGMLKEQLKKVSREILEEVLEEEKFLMTRREIAEAIGCDVDTFDLQYRYKPGFPYHKKGNHEAWNKKEVFDFMHKNRLLK